jgi:hypothetical protein
MRRRVGPLRINDEKAAAPECGGLLVALAQFNRAKSEIRTRV